MKLLSLSVLLMLMAINAAYASDSQSFVLAMDYSTYFHVADNDTFSSVKKALAESPYEKKGIVAAKEDLSVDEKKWNTFKDFKTKARNLSGGGFVDANDGVSVGAFAGYQFDEIDENKLNEAYSLTVNVKLAL